MHKLLEEFGQGHTPPGNGTFDQVGGGTVGFGAQQVGGSLGQPAIGFCPVANRAAGGNIPCVLYLVL